VTWEETNQGTDRVYVKQLVGGAWVQDGGPLNLDDVDSADGPALADIDGLPYVAFDQATPAQLEDVTVERWDGTAWSLVGGIVNQGTNPIPPAITAVGGVPFVASLQAPPTTTTTVNRNLTVLTRPLLRVSLLTPGFSSEQAIATDAGALPAVRVRDYGTNLPIGFQYGRGSSLGTSTTPVMTGGTGSDTIIQAISGLSPSTPYSWRAYATDGTVDTAFGPTLTFKTEAASTTGPKGKAGKIEVVTCRQTHSHGVRRLSRGSYTLRTRSGRTTVRLS
jgi:hypothetical protein